MEAVRIECEGSGVLPIEQLVPFQGALKTLSKENYLKLKAELLAEGFSFPVFVWAHEGSNYIIDGHQRVNTLLKMRDEGYKIPPIPVASVKAPTYKSAKKKVLAAASVYGRVDDQGLYEFLNNAGIEIDEIIEKIDLPYVDLEKFKAGYGGDSGGGGGSDQDDVPEPPKVARTKLGDLYELGGHRLLCGDSTSKECVDRLMGGEKADMVFTDPPYGCSLGKTILGEDIENDELTGEELEKFFDGVFSLLTLKDWATVYWFYSSNRVVETRKIAEKYFKLKDTLIWIKDSFVPGRNDYQPQYEPLLYLEKLGKGKVGRIWNGERNKSNVWNFHRDRGVEHPTNKPVYLIEFAIGNSSNAGGLVIDPFLGSGSTLIACEKTNRKCYGMELDPAYCDVIVKRWEDFTGKNAVLIKGSK